MGLGEGVAPSSASDMVARVIPNEERSRAMSFIFGGLHVGSLLGLLVAPALIERFGWQTVFYAFGGLGEWVSIGQTGRIAATACVCLHERCWAVCASMFCFFVAAAPPVHVDGVSYCFTDSRSTLGFS